MTMELPLYQIDAFTNKLFAGNAAGVTSVAALWGPFSRTVLASASPTCFLEHIRELPALIDRLDATRRS